MPYKLSASLQAHSSDVRAVASPIDTLVLSASRDRTAVAWSRSSSTTKEFVPESTFTAAHNYVNSVCYVPPSAENSRGCLAAGGNDKVINIYPLDSSSPSGDPKYTLVGHTENVCALDASSSGLIISGSWDKTAKVWKDFREIYELKGHTHSVWAVRIVDEDTYLTGSADMTIKMWQKNKVLQTYSGHTSAVRGLALLPGIGFASCSNDSEIRIWTAQGDVVSVLSGHTSFVYSLTALPNGDIVSSGEDRTVRIWRGEECIQTLVHPAISVWAVSSMPNGDIVSGSSDGVVRVFSEAEERWADADELRKYDETIASQALPSQQVGDVKKTDLPGLEALNSPGKKVGDVKMVRNGDNVEAYQWDSATGWQKIGDVVDAVGSGRKQLYEGKEYDYVFDVDIQDGVPPLKLPYNANENPYTAAQRFLASHDLPMSYLDQVVQFIERNASGVNLTSSTEYADPFTGATRYTPSSSSVPPRGAAASGDPFTGAGRYVSSSQAAPPTTSAALGYSDPFTGGTRYTPAGSFASTPPVSVQSQYQPARQTTIIPVRTFLSFKQANVNAMRNRIREIDESLQNEISTMTLAMYPEEVKEFEVAFAYLSEAVTGAAPSAPQPGKSILEAITQILERWPPSPRFPVIDLARLISGFCPSSYSSPDVAGPFFAAVLKAADWESEWETPLPKHRETNVVLALRALANAFQESTTLADADCDWVAAVLMELSGAPYGTLVKNHRIALATLLYNISCVRLKEQVSEAIADAHFSLLASILNQERSDAETAYRSLVALGNILFAVKAQRKSVDTSSVRQDLAALQLTFPEDRVKAVVKDIESLL